MEKPKLQIAEEFTSRGRWITAIITVAIAYYFSGLKLHIVPILIAIAIVVLGVLIVSLFFYIVRYIKFIIRVLQGHDRIIELYGQKESEVAEKDKIISDYEIQKSRSFEIGTVKGRAIMYNLSFEELMNRDIEILEKLPGDKGVEILFGLGADSAVEEKMLMSIVTKYGESLRGVVEITEVQAEVCRGIVITKVNRDFWTEVEKDLYSNSAPPVGVKARLYRSEDLVKEIELLKETQG